MELNKINQRPTLQPARVVTAREAADIERRLGLDGGRRGIGFISSTDKGEYSDSERMQDARKIFISLCAGAYSQNTLTERNPIAPQTICREVQKAGGNIRWLSADSGRQHTFHFYYCEHVHKAVPFDKVWSNANKNQSKDQNKTKEEPKEPSVLLPLKSSTDLSEEVCRFLS